MSCTWICRINIVKITVLLIGSVDPMGSPSILMAFSSELEKPRSKNSFKSRNTTTSQAILSKKPFWRHYNICILEAGINPHQCGHLTFDKGIKNTLQNKSQKSTNHACKTRHSTVKEQNSIHISHPAQKSTQKWVKDRNLNQRSKQICSKSVKLKS